MPTPPAVLTLAQAVAALERRYPPAAAQDWDAVGLVVGDPAQPVRRVLFAVDPVAAVADEAVAWGADLLVTHHPLFLRGVHGFAGSTAKGSVAHRLVRAGVALFAAHTNADAAADGVADALARVIGLVDLAPLVALAGDESVGLGRVGRLPEPEPLEAFARRVAAALPPVAQGVRYAGDPGLVVRSVAVLGGSGDSEFDAVRAAGADVYVTSDLRHHPASEARERAVFEGAGTPALVDTAHFASEWPWLAVAARRLADDLAALGATVETRVSVLVTDPWTGHVATPAPRKDTV